MKMKDDRKRQKKTIGRPTDEVFVTQHSKIKEDIILNMKVRLLKTK